MLQAMSKDPENPVDSLQDLLSQAFYFSQTQDGRVLQVHYPETESEEVADFKRGIVSAMHLHIQDSASY